MRDIVVGTDPDCDRLGIVRDNNGKWHYWTEIKLWFWWLHFYYNGKKAVKLTGKQFVGSTIVSTPMMMELATNMK
jgi:phosphomannomutase